MVEPDPGPIPDRHPPPVTASPPPGDATAPAEMPPRAEITATFRPPGQGIRLAGAGEASPAPPPSTPPGLPERFGRYRVLGEVARGGVGIVYKVRDSEIGRDLALKVPGSAEGGEPMAFQRFIEEAQVGGQLQHPGIVPVHELGLLSGDVPYFTMDYVKGKTLAAILRLRAHPDEDRPRLLGIFEAVCQTVAYAHARGVIHRDLKPSNVMVGRLGEVLVLDWGLAKVLSEGGIHDELKARKTHAAPAPSAIRTIRTEGAGSPSIAGAILGTPAYMAPEQAGGRIEDLDERTDVFGLGAILCEILTGKPPYAAGSTEEAVRKAIEGDLAEALARLDGCGADPALTALARSCLALEPRRRPRDAGHVARAIRGFLESLDERARTAEVVAAEARTHAEGERKARWLALAIAAVAVAAILAGGGAALRMEDRRRAAEARATAEAEAEIAVAVRIRGVARGAGGDAPARWAEALEAAERAVALAGAAEVDLPVRARAEEVVAEVREAKAEAEDRAARDARDRAMAARIESIRLELHGGPAEVADAAFAAAFRDHFRHAGLDWDALRPEAAGAALAGSAIGSDLVRAIDAWALAVRKIPGPRWKDLLRIAAAGDPDPWGLRIRQALEEEDGAALKSLAGGIPDSAAGPPGGEPPSSLDGGIVPAASYDLLAAGLGGAGDRDGATSLLRKAAVLHPGDLGIHHSLAILLSEAAPPRIAEALSHFAAAVALREESPHAWIDLGRASSDGDVDRAVSCFREAVRLDPGRVEAWESLGDLLLRSIDPAGAAAAFGEAVRLAGDRPGTLARLAEAVRAKGDRDAAVAILRRAADLEPRSPAVRLSLAEWLAERGDHREAARILAVAPDGTAGGNGYRRLLLLGRSLLRAGDPRAASEPLIEAADLRPADPEPIWMLGIALGRSGRIEEGAARIADAVRLSPDLATIGSDALRAAGLPRPADAADLEAASLILGRAIEGRPGRPWLLAARGTVRLRLGDLDGARTDLEAAAASDPRSGTALRALGLLFHRSGRLDEALSALDRSFGGGPEDLAALVNRAAILHGGGRTDEAVAAIGKALALAPGHGGGGQERADLPAAHARAHVNLGLIRLAEGRPAEAAAEFSSALRIEPDDAEVHAHHGEASLAAKKILEGLASFRRALELDPGNAVYLSDVGRSLLHLGRFPEAIEVLDRALAIDPTLARAWNNVGICRLGRGAIGEAIEALDRSRTLDPALWQPSLNLAEAHLRAGNSREAAAALARALAGAPGSDAIFGTIDEMLARDDIDLRGALGPIAAALDAGLGAAADADPRTVESFLRTWSRDPRSLGADRPLAVARREVARTGWRDPHAVLQFARVLRAAGRTAEAVLALEEAAALDPAGDEARILLAELRREALPDLPTFASIDAALEGTEEIPPAGGRWRLSRGRAARPGGLEWTGRAFDDTSWEAAAGGARSRDGPGGGLVLDDMYGSYTTVRMRGRFRIDHPERYRRIFLSIETEDSYRAWIDGREEGPAAEIPIAPAPGGGEIAIAVLATADSEEDPDFRIRASLLGEPDPALDAERTSGFRKKAAGDPAAAPLLDYLEGRILERAGRPEEAAERFRRAIAAGPVDPAPFRRLVGVLSSPEEVRRAYSEHREAIQRGPVPDRLLRRPPEPPIVILPRPGATIGGPEAVLEGAPFVSLRSDAPHRMTRWRLVEEIAGRPPRPLLDLLSQESLETLALTAGLLQPAASYRLRISHIDVDGRDSGLGEEVRFRTGRFPIRPVPFDLSGALDRDIVLDPGDGPNDRVDHLGFALVADGFDGEAENPSIRGLPRDGRVGVHRLAPFGGLNAIRRTLADRRETRIAVPRAVYTCLRFLVTGGTGSSRVPIRIDLAGGRRQVAEIPCPDWLLRSPDGTEGPAAPAWTGMDRSSGRPGGLDGRKAFAVYEVVIPVEGGRELEAIAILPGGSFSNEVSTFNLLAITGMERMP